MKEESGDTVVISARLPKWLVEQLDAHVEALSKKLPDINRSLFVAVAIKNAVDAANLPSNRSLLPSTPLLDLEIARRRFHALADQLLTMYLEVTGVHPVPPNWQKAVFDGAMGVLKLRDDPEKSDAIMFIENAMQACKVISDSKEPSCNPSSTEPTSVAKRGRKSASKSSRGRTDDANDATT